MLQSHTLIRGTKVEVLIHRNLQSTCIVAIYRRFLRKKQYAPVPMDCFEYVLPGTESKPHALFLQFFNLQPVVSSSGNFCAFRLLKIEQYRDIYFQPKRKKPIISRHTGLYNYLSILPFSD